MKTSTLHRLIALFVGGLLSLQISALAVSGVEEEPEKGESDCHYTWRNNWFVQVGAGISCPVIDKGWEGEKSPGKSLKRKSMNTTYNIGVGHWVSPYLGVRLNGMGGALHWDNPAIPNIEGWTKARHISLNFEVMWDMCNTLRGVKSGRLLSLLPFAGIGADYTWGLAKDPTSRVSVRGVKGIRNVSWTLPISLGMQIRLRLYRTVSVFAEARFSFYHDNRISGSAQRGIGADITAIGGFDFNIGSSYCSGGKKPEISEGKVRIMNDEINRMREVKGAEP